MTINDLRDKKLHEVFEKLYNNTDYSDVKFIVGNTNISAHSLVLLMKSPKFYETHVKGKCEQPTIEVTNTEISESIFIEFLKFIYTDTCTLTDTNVNEILELAIKYEMKTLETYCLDWIIERITVENACTYLQVSIEKSNELFRRQVLEFIRRNFYQVLKTKTFMGSKSTTVEDVLKLNGVSGEGTEIDVYDALLKWTDAQLARDSIESNGANKKRAIGRLIYTIRFPTMTSPEFALCVSKQEGILNGDETSTIFLEIHKKTKNAYGFSDRLRTEIYEKIENLDTTNPKEVVVGDHPNHTWESGPLSKVTKFKVSKSVVVVGVHVTGSNVERQVNIRLLDHENHPIAQGNGTVGENNYARINLSEPVRLQPDRQYSFFQEYDNREELFWCYRQKTMPWRTGIEVVFKFTELSRLLNKIYYV